MSLRTLVSISLRPYSVLLMAPTARPWLKMAAVASSAKRGGTRTTQLEAATRWVGEIIGGRMHVLQTGLIHADTRLCSALLLACHCSEMASALSCYLTCSRAWPQCPTIASCSTYSQEDCSCSVCKDRFTRTEDGSSCMVRRVDRT